MLATARRLPNSRPPCAKHFLISIRRDCGTGESFATDLAVLLNAVEANDTDGAVSAADTIDMALANAGSEDGIEPSAIDDPISASIDQALSTLEDASSSRWSTSLHRQLKGLLEALKSGTDVDLKLQSVMNTLRR